MVASDFALSASHPHLHMLLTGLLSNAGHCCDNNTQWKQYQLKGATCHAEIHGLQGLQVGS